METIRIPNRYSKQLSRIADLDRLFIFDSLMLLSIGENVKNPDTITGDILELIWRDSLQMEKKNGKFEENTVGKLLATNPPTNPPTYSPPEVKGSEVKGSEIYNHFQKFWKEYPVKKSKPKANQIFLKLSEKTQIKCIFSIQEQKEDVVIKKMKKQNGEDIFIAPWKHPTTWLNQGCWEDELEFSLQKEIKNIALKHNVPETEINNFLETEEFTHPNFTMELSNDLDYLKDVKRNNNSTC